jgi:hypothetical protein
MDCWASIIGGCSGKGSREHLVSASLWTSDRVDVSGLPWCKDAPKRIGLASLTGKLLCTEHNSQLSGADEAGKVAFDAFRDADELAHERNTHRPHRRWHIRRFDVPGVALERWFLKTTINLAITQKSHLRWQATGEPVDNVPLELVEVAFAKRELRKPMGLYFVALVGQKVLASETVAFAPLFLHEEHLVGGTFTFRGVRFLLYVGTAELPARLDLPGTTLSGWEDGEPHYRIRRHRWKVGKHVSHYVDLGWPSEAAAPPGRAREGPGGRRISE